ncbi:class I SAM-dependent methyltransferase [Alicyclobacillus fodiniaquatilis]|uniref:Class I SAM-dependent methyltransferase n=1 Tax=Alicyclobacillus fodiniaquatilis TaxID=1661150 RepID=A0ABW4JG76_9BACL
MRTADSQFAKNAEKYRDAPLFAEGEDLGLMVNSIRLSGTETVLDIGAGAGHTALAFAPHVQFCYGVDVTEEMVQVANQFAADKGVRNAQFQVGDVAELPYDDASFDIVTCRFAAHHFTDVERAGVTQEMRQKLVSFLQSAAPDCKETFRVMFTEDGVPQSFCLKVALVHGRKRSV